MGGVDMQTCQVPQILFGIGTVWLFSSMDVSGTDALPATRRRRTIPSFGSKKSVEIVGAIAG
jgi:hypothetical protein